jgi:heterodisulfide reductase subunit C
VTALVGTGLTRSLEAIGPFDAKACMNCGVCTAACPLGVNVLPRRLFRFALLGLEDRLLEAREPIFSCLLCRACEASCPAGVHITENMRILRHWLLGEGG